MIFSIGEYKQQDGQLAIVDEVRDDGTLLGRCTLSSGLRFPIIWQPDGREHHAGEPSPYDLVAKTLRKWFVLRPDEGYATEVEAMKNLPAKGKGGTQPEAWVVRIDFTEE